MKHIKYFVGIIFLIILDQIAKHWAVTTLKAKESIAIIKDIIVLQYLENRGAAFGMLQNKQAVFYVITIIVLLALTFYYFKMPNKKKMIPLRIGYVFLCAGAIGNLIDRVMQQYVVDFIYLKWINFPIFNVADIYVTLSVSWFVLLILFYYKEEDFKFI